MVSKRLLFPLVWIISFVGGCSGLTPSSSPLSAPFFLPTSEDTTRFATLTLTNTEDLRADQLRVVQVLQKQVRERDRRIAVLRSQLAALKVIDQDHEERKRTLKTPATLLPLMDHPR
jgi:hypothetical protein